MQTQKRKPGRPKKIVTPVESKKSSVKRDYKEELRLADVAIATLEEICETLREDKEYWFQVADKAHRNEEEILKELSLNLDRILFHCHSVKENAGNVTIDDVTYCLSLTRRVMDEKFAYKPKLEVI